METRNLPDRYFDYVKMLREYIGEDVHVNADVFPATKRLEGLTEISDQDPNLFPHSVSFDDGTDYNLADIVSITKIGTSRTHPRKIDILYCHNPDLDE